MPILMYGLETLPLQKNQLNSLITPLYVRNCAKFPFVTYHNDEKISPVRDWRRLLLNA